MNERHITDDDFALLEGEIASLIARIESSTLNAAALVKEPADQTDAMIPAAYAFFEVLVRAGNGSGSEIEWGRFLSESLAEVIAKNHALLFN